MEEEHCTQWRVKRSLWCGILQRVIHLMKLEQIGKGDWKIPSAFYIMISKVYRLRFIEVQQQRCHSEVSYLMQ